MRILYFSPRDCWPPNTGARLRDYNLARELTRHAQIDYLGLRAPGEEPGEPLPASAGFRRILLEREKGYTAAKLIGGLAGPLPVTLRNFWSESVAAELQRLLRSEQYDWVQIEGVHLAPYVRIIRAAMPGVKIAADWHNIESELMTRYAEGLEGWKGWPKRWYARRTAQFIEHAEGEMLRACDLNTVVSHREREKLLARDSGANVEVVPNGVDVAFFGEAGRTQVLERNLVFVGSMDYHANVDAVQWFAHEIWPLLRDRKVGWQWKIVGRNPGPAVRALSEQDVIVTGTVPDVRKYYREAMALVVPLRVGGGTRLKILEAMAAGVPVISTTLGAEGIECENGVHIIIEDSAEDFCAAIQRLGEQPALRQRLAENAKVLVNEKYSWEHCGNLLARALMSASGGRSRTVS